jgi:threonine dehydratase
MNCPTLSNIEAAAKRIEPYIEKTPVLTCSGLDRMVGARLFFKCENFQKVGAFKFRGATNAVFSLSEEEARRGVATHSSGNHGAALALAARNRGIKAYVVMPENSATIKKEAVAGYGAEITFCQPTQEAREAGLVEVVKRTGATFIHPYNDYRIIAGQGTAALELLEEIRDLDVVMAPIGGGGLMSGTALTVSELSPKTEIIGAEPEGADDAQRSLREGRIVPSLNPRTICDGLRTSLGDKTFPIIREHVGQIVTVSDEINIRAMRHLWERMKIVVEPSAAVPFGALLERKIDLRGRRIGIIISGGNVDLERLPWLSIGDDQRT